MPANDIKENKMDRRGVKPDADRQDVSSARRPQIENITDEAANEIKDTKMY